MLETAGMRLRQFSAQESRKDKAGKYAGKQQWIEYLRRLFLSFFPLNLDGSGKVLKLLCGEWKEVIFKKQKIVQTTPSLVL